MAKEYTCVIPGEPSTLTYQNGLRSVSTPGGVRCYKTSEFEHQLMANRLHMRQSKPSGWKPLTGPTLLIVEFRFGFNTTHTNRHKAFSKYPKVTKPDCDNLVKAIKDCLEAEGIVTNDAVFYRDDLSKWYTADPCTIIKVIGEECW